MNVIGVFDEIGNLSILHGGWYYLFSPVESFELKYGIRIRYVQRPDPRIKKPYAGFILVGKNMYDVIWVSEFMIKRYNLRFADEDEIL